MNNKNYIQKLFSNKAEDIKSRVYTKLCDLSAEFAFSKEPASFYDAKKMIYQPIAIGEHWGGLWDCAWFRFTGTIPLSAKDKKIVCMIDINGEGCLFDGEGTAIRGITNINSEFERSLGLPGKRVIDFVEKAEGGETVDVFVDGACNDLFGKFQGGYLKQAEIATCHDEVRDLYYDFWVLNDLLATLDVDSSRYAAVYQALNSVTEILITYSEKEVQLALKILKKQINRKSGNADLIFTAIGHAHLDLAWLWPLRETKRKAERTFSTLIDLLEKYPYYIAGISQPQQFEWLKERQPVLFEKVKKKILDRRIEAQGVMWVESDLNIVSGESIIRQIIYGKTFYKQEFGLDCQICHLPDVFGFNGALPQILKKTGTNYLLTIKLSWNKYNKFPFHTFHWKGIDGTSVLTHMPPEGSYNSPISPQSIKKAEQNYAEKGICGEALILYGIGDGGGGPGKEHLERLKRELSLNGLCPVKSDTTLAFFIRIAKSSFKYPEYCGELYLEKHQGTYTTQAKSKSYNRRMENLLRKCEMLCAAATVQRDAVYPQEQIEKIWKEVLLYQFHDILPGTSIKRVYDESLIRYAELEKDLLALIESARDCLFAENTYFNTLSADREEIIERGGKYYEVTIPALSSVKVFNEISSLNIKARQRTIENKFLKAVFNVRGEIISLYDKLNKRETLSAPSNILQILNDTGDAWDMSDGYLMQKAGCFEIKEQKTYLDGKYAVLEQKFYYGQSSYIQTIKLDACKPYLEFSNEVDWNESFKYLRAEFSPNVKTDFVNCNIQFGNIKRSTLENTSIERAQEEICAQKYIDLSSFESGFALLSDCKYGYRAKNNQIFISLLRSPNYPAENADQGHHEFRYALYPHQNCLEYSDVVEKSYEFNDSLIENVDVRILTLRGADNVMLETVKKAEIGEYMVLRLYESKGRDAEISLDLHFPHSEVSETTMDERDARPIDGKRISFRPFEIKTITIDYRRKL